jgi:hypothetical protein
MGFEAFCVTLIAVIIGLVLCFGGYRLFLVLLPFWGFFFGFFLGAQALQALFGVGFFATVTSWVVGFVIGVIFAVLSYLFYVVGVVLIAGWLGYAIGAGLMNLIGLDAGLITFLVGLVGAIIVAGVTIFFNLQKYVIIIATAVGGAAAAIGTLAFGAVGLQLSKLLDNPVQAIFSAGWVWALLFIVLAIAGIVVQLRVNRSWDVEAYENRI